VTMPIEQPVMRQGDNNSLVNFTGLDHVLALERQVVAPLDNPLGTTRHEPNTIPGAIGAAVTGDGVVAKALRTAMSMLNTPYVWGGSGATGVDCSGLIYYALNSAGFHVARVRASDYGHMGVAVAEQDARPGDVVYYDEPGGTDHVGIYLGNGMMVQAPQSGDVVKISPIGRETSIRRILPDTAWAGMQTDPAGRYTYRYGGHTYIGGR
jgi:cell wall-associated NlpC family hydrolase